MNGIDYSSGDGRAQALIKASCDNLADVNCEDAAHDVARGQELSPRDVYRSPAGAALAAHRFGDDVAILHP